MGLALCNHIGNRFWPACFRNMVTLWIAFGLLVLSGKAQTKITENILQLEESGQSPSAKVGELAWIAGSWKGEALGGAFEETWNPPSGDSMLGMFKLIRNGKTQFSEIMTIVEQGESLVLKLKHFHGDLRGWEEKDQTVEFPLVRLQENEANFQGLTFRRFGTDRLNIYVAMKGDGENRELEFTARRSEKATQAATELRDTSGDSSIEESVDGQLSADQYKELTTYIAKVQQDWEVPGLAVAIVRDGKVLLANGWGVRSLSTQDPVDANTLFAIASNSKAFTAAAIGILVDDGKLAWDDPVIKHIPTFQMPDPWVTREMTIRDLLCHRSGMDTFSGDLLWYDTTYTADDVVDRIRYLKPTSSFRSRYGYQNLMYIAAGKVIERVSGLSWAEFIQQKILNPTGMSRTTTSVAQMVDNFAMPHNRSAGSPDSGSSSLRVLPLGNVDNSWGACGLNSSVNDLARWMLLQLSSGEWEGKRVISGQRLQEMWQPNTAQALSAAAIISEPTRNFQTYGLGYVLNDWHGRKIVSHSGGLDGMISQLAMVPAEKTGVVVLTNSESSASRFIRDRILEVLWGIEDRRDKSAEAVARKAASDQAAAKKREEQDAARHENTSTTIPVTGLVGTFQSQLYGDVTVAFEEEHLVLRLVPAPNFVADLEHWQYNTFVIRWRDSVKYDFPRGFATFTIDASGSPHQLIIDQPNDDFWFYELELFRKD